MPKSTAQSQVSTTPHMGVAHNTMAAYSYWVCRPIFWPNVSCSCGRPLQVAWGCEYEICRLYAHNWNSTRTIEILRSIFARNGVPEQLVSDNGPQFTSDEFQTFLKRNGIKHITSAPYTLLRMGSLNDSFKPSNKRWNQWVGRRVPQQPNWLTFFLHTGVPHTARPDNLQQCCSWGETFVHDWIF